MKQPKKLTREQKECLSAHYLNCEDFLVDSKNGDYDTVGILYAIVPEGYKVEINRFFKEENNKFVEITEVEYNMRKHCREYFGASNNDCQRCDVVEDDKENESK